MKHIHKLAALFVCGISTFTLLPHNDYLKSIPTAEQLTRKNWEKTGNLLAAAMEKYKRIQYGQTGQP